jgi:hypothetical protein
MTRRKRNTYLRDASIPHFLPSSVPSLDGEVLAAVASSAWLLGNFPSPRAINPLLKLFTKVAWTEGEPLPDSTAVLIAVILERRLRKSDLGGCALGDNLLPLEVHLHDVGVSGRARLYALSVSRVHRLDRNTEGGK